MPKHSITIALAGNPNSGKSTIFNNLTGTRQKVGNWPGVTVEKKEGHLKTNGYDLAVVDLPGTYSLTAYSIEEIVARNFILDEKPDVVVGIIDASNLERNLYLATQLRELDTKVIFVLNMADCARERGIKIDADKLSELLDVPVIFTVGNRNQGTQEVLKTIISVAETEIDLPRTRRVYYGKDIEKAINELSEFIREKTSAELPYHIRWIAIKLLENDRIVKDRVLESTNPHGEAILQQAELKREHLREFFDEEPEIVMTDHRYGFIAGIVKEVLKTVSKQRVDVSRQIDQVLTNRLLGLPIFVFFIWAMFQLTFSLGAYPMDWIDAGVGWLGVSAGRILPEGLFADLIVNGIIAGVGSVAIFLPNILILFFCIALFEDTGYMARAAFLMDKVMHLIGLHGKSFIPMLMGFGCNVPACLGCRIMETERERLICGFVASLVPCAARSIVIMGLVAEYVGFRWALLLYVIDFALIFILGRIAFKVVPGESMGLIMEMPVYRWPTAHVTFKRSWDRMEHFVREALPLMVAGNMVIVLANMVGLLDHVQRAMSPVTVGWLGLPAAAGVVLIFGVLRKELTLILLASLMGTSDFSMIMTPIQMFVFAFVVMIYVPCISTIAVLVKEFGHRRAGIITISEILLAVVLGGVIYRVMPFFGL